MKKIIKFINLPATEKRMLAEAVLRLLQARIILWVLPFKHIAPGLGEHMHETPASLQPQYKEVIRQVRDAVRRVIKLTPWSGTCLVQAVAAKKMLRRRGVPSTLYLGVAKDKTVIKGLKAHAWLRSGNMILTGGRGVELSAYAVVSTFGEQS